MRQAAAVVVVGFAVAGAVYLGSVKLGHAADSSCRATWCWDTLTSARAAWQIPVAILIATLGVAAAVAVARPRRSP